jgi:signal transduction histidine kinase
VRALRGLRGQLALVFALVFSAVTLLTGTYQYQQVGHVLRQSDDQRLRSRALALLEQVETYPQPIVALPGRGELLRVLVETTGRAPQELFHSPGFTSPPEAGGEADGLRAVLVTRRQTSESGQPQRVHLWLGHSDAALVADLGHVRRSLGWALAGSLGLAVLLAAALGRQALGPLRRISQQARRIGAAPGSERLPEPATGDEVQELARTLNQMLDRLQAGAELQDNFLAAAAHELRTPLAVALTSLAVTRQAPDLPAHLGAALDVQADELQRLGQLVDDFLTVSRLRANALPLARQPVALDELAVSLADRLLPRFRAAGRRLDLTIDEQVANYTVVGDADKLTTVLLNLLENALRHAPPAAAVQVHLGCEPATGWLFAEVSNPVHQSLGDLARLTTAYYQADVLSSGAGLGLWLSNRIAELHGAPLALHEAAGRFSVRLRLPPT